MIISGLIGFSYGIIGSIIENITKMNYSEIITKTIMKPLKINAYFATNIVHEKKSENKKLF